MIFISFHVNKSSIRYISGLISSVVEGKEDFKELSDDEQILKNYLPAYLFAICGKIFERLRYDSLFEYFIENDLISPNRSGFKPGDS